MIGFDTLDRTILSDIEKERERQYKKWGPQQHTERQWDAIFEEEMAEFRCKLVCGYDFEECYKELIESIAVLCAWARDMIGRKYGIYGEERKGYYEEDSKHNDVG